MKTRNQFLLIFISGLLILFSGCKKDPVDNTPEIKDPVVTTSSTVTGVSRTGVTVGGSYVADERTTIAAVGVEYKQSTAGAQYVAVPASSVVNPFAVSISGLTPATQYSYRAYVAVGSTKYYGEVRTFTTGSDPTVTTSPTVTGLSRTEATVGGSYSADNSIIVAAVGVAYKLKADGDDKYVAVPADDVESPFTVKLTELQPDKQYSYKAYITVGEDTYYGEALDFSTSANPTVTTSATVADLSDSGATVGGSYSAPANVTITAVGVEYKLASAGDDQYVAVAAGTVANPFTVALTGLTEKTAYSYRAYVAVGSDKYYGEAKTFTTEEAPAEDPEVTTADATNLSDTGATVGGSYEVADGVTVAAAGVEYKLAAAGDDQYIVEAADDENSPFTVALTGLTAETEYSYRAYITVGEDTYYGEVKTFTTEAAPAEDPEVTTADATNLSDTGTTVGGSYVVADGVTVAAAGVEYKLAAEGDDQYVAAPADAVESPFTVALTGLTAETTYSYKAYITVDGEKYYGEVKTLTTEQAAQAVLTITGVTLEGSYVAGTEVGADAKIVITYENAEGDEEYSYTFGDDETGLTASNLTGTFSAGTGTIDIPLSGTPATDGQFTLTLTGTPDLGAAGNISLTVTTAQQSLTITGVTLEGSYVAGTEVGADAKIVIAYEDAEGDEEYSYTFGDDETGLTASNLTGTFSAGTGTIDIPLSGTPATDGQFTLTLTGTPDLGAAGSISLTVTEAP